MPRRLLSLPVARVFQDWAWSGDEQHSARRIVNDERSSARMKNGLRAMVAALVIGTVLSIGLAVRMIPLIGGPPGKLVYRHASSDAEILQPDRLRMTSGCG